MTAQSHTTAWPPGGRRPACIRPVPVTPPPAGGGAMPLPHHFQQVLLQRFHSGERLHLQHATRPVNQSRLTWRSLQTETQPPRQDLRSGRVHPLSLSFRRHTDHKATFWHTGFRTQLGLTCRLYKEPGVSYRCRGRRSIDSRTAISFRIKATAGRLQRTRTSTVNDLYERLFLSLTCERHRGGSKTVDNRKYRLFPSECCFYIF